MTDLAGCRSIFDTPATYRIRVQGTLATNWSERLEDMTISTTETADVYPVTTLVGKLIDQAALIGILNTLYEIQLPLLFVECLADEL